MNLFISGYPYIRENYFRTFDFYSEKKELLFFLPKEWRLKRGGIVYTVPRDDGVIAGRAFFYHSHYPVIGGLLKGWMPAFPLVLWKNRSKIKIVFSPLEPILLTTFYQAFFSKIFSKKHYFFTWENIPYENKFSGFNLWIKKILIKLNILF